MRSKHYWNRDVMVPRICGQPESDEIVAIGYPDETQAFERFAQELALTGDDLTLDLKRRPIQPESSSILIDFRSRTEEEADRSLVSPWCCPLGFNIGTFATISATIDVNAQNERKRRHLAMIALGVSMSELQDHVLSEVLDRRSCIDPYCGLCPARPNRGIIDVLRILSHGLNRRRLYLFSSWNPSPLLRLSMEHAEIELRHFPLSRIPDKALEQNQWYTTWFGSPAQAAEFRKIILNRPSRP